MPDLHQTEDQLQDAVLELARACGWRTAHFRPGRTATGWRTSVAGDGEGFPDLVLVRGGAVLVVELKAGRGRLSEAQEAWLAALEDGGVDVRVWRPDDWPEIEATLTAPRRAGRRAGRSG